MFPTARRPAPTHPARSAAGGSYSRSVIAGAIVAAALYRVKPSPESGDENTPNSVPSTRGQVLQGNQRTQREMSGTDTESKRVLRLLPCSYQV